MESSYASEGSPERHDEGRDRVRSAFVVISALALIAFVLMQVVAGSDANTTQAQAKKLMPQIGAELIDQPLTPAQLQWSLEAGDGRTLTLADLPRDRLIFLNFWATWCPPCRDELPSMFRLRQELSDRAFVMVAVSYDDTWSDIRDFFRRWVGRLPSDNQLWLLKDPHLDPGTTLRESFGTQQMPDSYVIYNQHVLARFVNARNWISPSIVDYFKKITPPLDDDQDG